MVADRDPEPVGILYVCVANVCRSVFAERLTRRQLAETGVVVGSAGTHAVPGRPMHPYVRDVLWAYGAQTDGFASRRLSAGLLASAALVLAATAEVRDAAIALLPSALSRTFTVREYARLAGHCPPAESAAAAVAWAHRQRGRTPYVDPVADDIPDPEVTPAAFRSCADSVASVLAPVVATLTAAQPPARWPA